MEKLNQLSRAVHPEYQLARTPECSMRCVLCGTSSLAVTSGIDPAHQPPHFASSYGKGRSGEVSWRCASSLLPILITHPCRSLATADRALAGVCRSPAAAAASALRWPERCTLRARSRTSQSSGKQTALFAGQCQPPLSASRISRVIFALPPCLHSNALLAPESSAALQPLGPAPGTSLLVVPNGSAFKR